jgi:pyruvate-formate lyase
MMTKIIAILGATIFTIRLLVRLPHEIYRAYKKFDKQLARAQQLSKIKRAIKSRLKTGEIVFPRTVRARQMVRKLLEEEDDEENSR